MRQLFKLFVTEFYFRDARVDFILIPTKIYYSHSSVVSYSKNNKSTSDLKYMEAKYPVVREKIKECQTIIDYTSTKAKIADLFT